MIGNSLPAETVQRKGPGLRPTGGAELSTDLGAALMTSSTLRIISAASEALSSTWRFTWKDSVMPSSTMSPMVPSDISEGEKNPRSSSKSAPRCPPVDTRGSAAALTQPGGASVLLVCSSQLGHQVGAVVAGVVSDDGGQLQRSEVNELAESPKK